MSSWRSDFTWSWKGVIYKETGADIRFNRALFKDIYTWTVYAVTEKLRSLPSKQPFTLAVYPETIRPWYLIWGIFLKAGFKIKSAEKARDPDLAIHFLDESVTSPPKLPNSLNSLNFSCTDITKSRVASVFEEVFGYPLSVNPDSDTRFVAKSEGNGKHDGEILQGPIKPQPGMVYQKIVNNETDDGHVADLRCPTLHGRPLLVFIKERPVDKRFKNMNARARIEKPSDIFSEDELSLISQYCKKMRLDFGGIDVLRDKDSGKIYIVDVNKTDMIPLALPLREKLRAIDIMAEAFRNELVEEKKSI